jgi:glycerol kinase
MTNDLLLAIDQGTTGTTALLVNDNLEVRGRGYREIPQLYPAPGWVEHDPEAIWASVLGAVAEARGQAREGSIAGIGITNQRETVVCWDRASGQPLRTAIVWQDRRTADRCEAMRQAGLEETFQRHTGLLLDPYFAGTKMAWLLDNTPGLRERAAAGAVALSTVDSFLVWRLSGGASFVTDVSNASRTLLLDLERLDWNADLCRLLTVPAAALPRVVSSSGTVAAVRGLPGIADGTPIAGIAGDQQAALFGQDCLAPGDAKCTFGTGSFLLMNVGDRPVPSRHRLLATIAWRTDDGVQYALEGSAFVCGALVQWLRDGLHLIGTAAEIEPLAASVPDSGGVAIVPALAGLGAPHWRPEARGLICGVSRGTTAAHIARAALEAMALQNVDLVRAMEQDAGRPLRNLRVDGGAVKNNLLMQMQADLLGVPLVRPAMPESTALGAARLAARGLGLESGRRKPPNLGETTFEPRMTATERDRTMARWRDALARS